MMKYWLFLMLSWFSVSPDPVWDPIAAAMQSGQVSQLKPYFHTTMELSIGDNEGVFSHTHTEMILKKFFLTHPPEKFTIQDKGETGNSAFANAILKTKNGVFRVSFLLKLIPNKNSIRSIRIEPR